MKKSEISNFNRLLRKKNSQINTLVNIQSIPLSAFIAFEKLIPKIL